MTSLFVALPSLFELALLLVVHAEVVCGSHHRGIDVKHLCPESGGRLEYSWYTGGFAMTPRASGARPAHEACILARSVIARDAWFWESTLRCQRFEVTSAV